MNSNFKRDGFLFLPQFIEKESALALAEDYMSHTTNWTGDAYVPKSRSCNDFAPFFELLCQKTLHVMHLVEEPVLPSYAYGRVYEKGAELLKHTDREACEISLTLHLNGDRKWPFIAGEYGFDLNPGDALMYLGETLPHGREEYEGEYYAQAFLHYIRSRGKYTHHFFDFPNRFSIELDRWLASKGLKREEI